MKKIILLCFATIALTACNHLSSRAKQMVGDYYIQEISYSEPILKLNGDGSCVMTAIKPGVVTYSVEGKWNVEDDSLVIDLNPKKITWEGDSTLIAKVPEHVSYSIVSYNDITLEIENKGINFALHRRVNAN